MLTLYTHTHTHKAWGTWQKREKESICNLEDRESCCPLEMTGPSIHEFLSGMVTCTRSSQLNIASQIVEELLIAVGGVTFLWDVVAGRLPMLHWTTPTL